MVSGAGRVVDVDYSSHLGGVSCVKNLHRAWQPVPLANLMGNDAAVKGFLWAYSTSRDSADLIIITLVRSISLGGLGVRVHC